MVSFDLSEFRKLMGIFRTGKWKTNNFCHEIEISGPNDSKVLSCIDFECLNFLLLLDSKWEVTK